MKHPVLYSLKVICMVFFSAMVSAGAISFTVWLLGRIRQPRQFAKIFLGVLALSILINTAIVIIRLAFHSRGYSRIYSKSIDEGYTDKFFAFFEKRAKRALTKKRKNAATMELASCYAEAGRYTDAVETLHRIDFFSLSENARTEYFSAALNIEIISGNMAETEKIYAAGKGLLEKNSGDETDCTLAALSFARGDYYDAEAKFIALCEHALPDKVASECGVYLTMIYLQTDRLDKAKAAAEMTIPNISSYRDKQTMLRLMKCIENAYDAQNF